MRSDFPLVLIPLLPLAGAAINLLLGKRLGKASGTIGCTVVILAAFFGWWGAYDLWKAGEGAVFRDQFFAADWIHATELSGLVLSIKAGLMLDRLSAVMVLTITTIGSLIHIYSTAYMEHDEGFSRFFGYLNLFTGSMLILVLGDSLPVTFVGWEGVGLCSYLLIGFWYDKDANAYAGRKAFIVNRVGDFGFLLGIFFIFTATSTLNYTELGAADSINALRTPFHFGATYATMAGLLLFIGATGKSAQLPLYIWLPDAMAGPTPVSALIHAATMVTAGVYMIARLHFLFEIDPFVLAVIASVGAITALFAATMGITQRPIKKILAYSTVSQLGFMFIGVGTATYTAGLFHLVTHAVFKAGLFLAAGSIMHGLANEEDVMKMGGLRKKMPITRWSYFIYCLAIAGIPIWAGFFSKDAILAGALNFGHGKLFESVPHFPHWLGPAIYAMGLVAAFCTAFYMFRSYWLVFGGEYRGDQHTWDHAHESPRAMSWVLAVLAVGSTVVGFLGVPEVFHAGKGSELFAKWLEPAGFEMAEAHMAASTELALMGLAIVVSLAGIGLAALLYRNGPAPATDKIAQGAGGLYRLVYNKYYVDEIYDFLIVRPLRWTAEQLWRIVDVYVIDGSVRLGAAIVNTSGKLLRYLQNGDVQTGVVGVVVGTAAIVAVSMNWAAMTRAGHLGGNIQVQRRQNNEIVVTAPPPPQNRSLEYSFDFGDGTPAQPVSANSASHRYASGGSKKITVTVRDPRWDTRSSSSTSLDTTRNPGSTNTPVTSSLTWGLPHGSHSLGGEHGS